MSAFILVAQCPAGGASSHTGTVALRAESPASGAEVWTRDVDVAVNCLAAVEPVQEGLTAVGRALEYAEGVVQLSNGREDADVSFDLSLPGGGVLSQTYPGGRLPQGDATLRGVEVAPLGSEHVHLHVPCTAQGARDVTLRVTPSGGPTVERTVAVTCGPPPLDATVAAFAYDYLHSLRNSGYSDVKLESSLNPNRAAVADVRWRLSEPSEGRMSFFEAGSWLSCLAERRRADREARKYAADLAEYFAELEAWRALPPQDRGDEPQRPEEPEPFEPAQCAVLADRTRTAGLEEQVRLVAEWDCTGKAVQRGTLSVGVGNGGFELDPRAFAVELACGLDQAVLPFVAQLGWHQGRTVRRVDYGDPSDPSDDRTLLGRTEPGYVAPHGARRTHLSLAAEGPDALAPIVSHRAAGAAGPRERLLPLAERTAAAPSGALRTWQLFALPQGGEWSGELQVVLPEANAPSPVATVAWGAFEAGAEDLRRPVVIDWGGSAPAGHLAFLAHVGDRVPLPLRARDIEAPPAGGRRAGRGNAVEALGAFASRATDPKDWVLMASGSDLRATVGTGRTLNGSHARIALVPAVPSAQCDPGTPASCDDRQWEGYREAVETWAYAAAHLLHVAAPGPGEPARLVDGEWLDLLSRAPGLVAHLDGAGVRDVNERSPAEPNVPSAETWRDMVRNAGLAVRPGDAPTGAQRSVAVVVPVVEGDGGARRPDASAIEAFAADGLPAWPNPGASGGWQLAFGREAGACGAAEAPAPARAEVTLDLTAFLGASEGTPRLGLAWRVDGPVHRVYARAPGAAEWACRAFDPAVGP